MQNSGLIGTTPRQVATSESESTDRAHGGAEEKNNQGDNKKSNRHVAKRQGVEPNNGQHMAMQYNRQQMAKSQISQSEDTVLGKTIQNDGVPGSSRHWRPHKENTHQGQSSRSRQPTPARLNNHQNGRDNNQNPHYPAYDSAKNRRGEYSKGDKVIFDKTIYEKADRPGWHKIGPYTPRTIQSSPNNNQQPQQPSRSRQPVQNVNSNNVPFYDRVQVLFGGYSKGDQTRFYDIDNQGQTLTGVYDGNGGWNLLNDDGSLGPQLDRPFGGAGASHARININPKTPLVSNQGLNSGPASEGLNSSINFFDMSLRSQSVGYVVDMVKMSQKLGTKVNIFYGGHDPVALASFESKIKEAESEVGDLSQFYSLKKIYNGENSPWVEDSSIRSRDGKTAYIPADISRETKDKATQFVKANLDKEDPNYGLQGNTKRKLGVTVDRFNSHDRMEKNLNDSSSGIHIYRGNSYIEGGNLLAGTKANGEPYAIIGNDSVIVTSIHLEEMYNKNPDSMPQYSPSSIDNKIKELQVDSRDPIYNLTRQKLEKTQGLSGDELHKKTLETIAKQDIAKDIISQDVGVDRDSIAFIPQTSFHIDMQMRPIENGDVFINSEIENQKLLNKAIELSEDPQEKIRLEKMLEVSRENHERSKHYNPIIEEELRKIGLNPILSPGVFSAGGKNEPGA
ncbi:hypothetical protein CS022_24520 [Veronia nyctiphanis]|uniref:Uncharacterized protein n=1 Tax=Veronia nyctiphanis TaxID=1278244 RepID=A0A4Q0YCQ1_9GAMM|nr:hypothetical protein [Veronia nyctiphanis]RXJ66671.1 hypothetical protein CS022_24520 [Veronia nyctiphanis]